MKEKLNSKWKFLVTGFLLMLIAVLHFIPVSSHQDPCGYGADYRIILGQLDNYEEKDKIAHDGISFAESFQYGSQCSGEGNNRPNKLFVI